MSLETIAQELLDATEASRTTIRFDVPDDPYLPVFAEAVVPGVRAIRDERIEEVRQAPTFKYVDKTHDVLVQSDLPTEPLQGCAYLTDDFGVTAQMLAPILEGERLIGLISVHFTEGKREWTGEHVQALEDACEASRGCGRDTGARITKTHKGHSRATDSIKPQRSAHRYVNHPHPTKGSHQPPTNST